MQCHMEYTEGQRLSRLLKAVDPASEKDIVIKVMEYSHQFF